MVHKAFLLKDIPLFSKEGVGEICPIPDIFNDKKTSSTAIAFGGISGKREL